MCCANGVPGQLLVWKGVQPRFRRAIMSFAHANANRRQIVEEKFTQ
jgi:hypothetical protein